MAIGTAIAIGAIAASTAASAYAAHKQADAAKQAAQIQADAAGKATQAQSSALSPYTQAGGDAMNTLSRLLGAPGGSQFASGGNFTAAMPPAAAVGAGLPMMAGGQPGGPSPSMPAPSPGGLPFQPAPRTTAPGAGMGVAGMGGMPIMPRYRPPVSLPPSASAPAPGPVLDGSSPLRLEDFFARMQQ
jgi:hypothetical protein